eukprot:COSAG02_NODE_612_length_19541_cov_13.245150_1_plen_522_part_00
MYLFCVRVASVAAAAAAAAAGSSRLNVLGLQPEPEPEPELRVGASVDPALEAALAAGRYDDGSVAATLFRQWPLVALVKLPGIGGGRGVVTTQAVTAGTVLLSEAPFIPPPAAGWASAVNPSWQSVDDDGQGQRTAGGGGEPPPLHTAVAHLLLATGGIRRREMQELHPQSLDPAAGCLTEAQLERCWKEHAPTVDVLLRRYPQPPGTGSTTGGGMDAGADSSDGGGPYNRDEVLRCVLAVQFNAFGSGLYLALAMINHSCRPNASKFEPQNAAAPAPAAAAAEANAGAVVSNGTGKSEIVAVVDIPRGAEVTIHYANPITRSHRSRVDLFQAQHHFTLSETSPFDAIDPLLDGVISPESAWVATASVERRLDTLEPRMSAQSVGCLEEAQSCLKVALAVLPPQHLVVVRGHLAVVRAAQAVIAATARRRLRKTSAQGRSRTNQEQAEDEHVAHVAAVCALRSCVAVGESHYLPATHHERATTASDFGDDNYFFFLFFFFFVWGGGGGVILSGIHYPIPVK